MKFIKLLPLLLLPALILPSCGDNDEPRENMVSLTIDSKLNYISSYDLSTSTTEIFPGANYGIIANMDRNAIELSVNDLQFNKGERAISFTLPEMRMNVIHTGWKLEQKESVSVQAGASTVTVSDIKIDFNLRANGSQNLVLLSFVLDGRYAINTFFTHNQFIGTTTSTDLSDPADDPFTTQQSQYLVVFDGKTNKVQVQIANPKFLDKMPPLSIMVFDAIPMNFSNDGFTFSASEIIPSIKGTPYPDFKVSNLEGKVVAGKTLTLKFDCARFNRQVTVAGTAY